MDSGVNGAKLAEVGPAATDPGRNSRGDHDWDDHPDRTGLAELTDQDGQGGQVGVDQSVSQPDGELVLARLERADGLYRSARYEEAAREYQAVLTHDEQNWRALAGHNRAIRRHVPRWHFEMMHDYERAELYEAAIRQVVTPDRLVLDVGTGSGMLALMAARAGAQRVVACEAQSLVAEVAQRIVERSAYGEQVSVVPKMSTELTVPADLPRRADLLITETVDCGLLGEGILGTIAHAREHLLTDDAVIVPGRARVFGALVESVPLQQKNHVGEVCGFDLSEFNQLQSMEYFDSRLRRHEHRMLSEPFDVFGFDFHRDSPLTERSELAVMPTAAGTCHAVVFWFELELLPGITVTNSPEHPTSHWKQAVQVLPAAAEVRPGVPLPLSARHDGLHIHFALSGTGSGSAGDTAAAGATGAAAPRAGAGVSPRP